MFDRTQLVTGCPSEFRVQGQHVDRELHFVDHALTGAVPARKEFEVDEFVKGSISIFVMDCFVRAKLSAQMLFHYVSVFKFFGSLSAVGEGRNRDVDVAMSFDVPTKVASAKSIEGGFGLRRDLAFWAAKFLLSVNSKLMRVSVSCFQFAAMLACEFISFVGIFSAAGIRAIHRAVEWVSFEFFAVGIQVRFHHRKRLAAFLAGKTDWRSTGRVFFSVKVFASARYAAIFAPGINFALVAVKGLFAAQTSHLDWHGRSPLLGGRVDRSHVNRECQVAYAGQEK